MRFDFRQGYFAQTSLHAVINHLFLETRCVLLFILDLHKPVFRLHQFRKPCHVICWRKVCICGRSRPNIFNGRIIFICSSPLPPWRCTSSRTHYWMLLLEIKIIFLLVSRGQLLFTSPPWKPCLRNLSLSDVTHTSKWSWTPQDTQGWKNWNFFFGFAYSFFSQNLH